MKLLGKCGSLTPINPESIGAVPKGSSLVLCGEGGGVRGLSLPSHPAPPATSSVPQAWDLLEDFQLRTRRSTRAVEGFGLQVGAQN